nr:hypothetical protein Iba_chr14bCG10140 [Ipomoea batatas]
MAHRSLLSTPEFARRRCTASPLQLCYTATDEGEGRRVVVTAGSRSSHDGKEKRGPATNGDGTECTSPLDFSGDVDDLNQQATKPTENPRPAFALFPRYKAERRLSLIHSLRAAAYRDGTPTTISFRFDEVRSSMNRQKHGRRANSSLAVEIPKRWLLFVRLWRRRAVKASPLLLPAGAERKRGRSAEPCRCLAQHRREGETLLPLSLEKRSTPRAGEGAHTVVEAEGGIQPPSPSSVRRKQRGLENSPPVAVNSTLMPTTGEDCYCRATSAVAGSEPHEARRLGRWLVGRCCPRQSSLAAAALPRRFSSVTPPLTKGKEEGWW